MKNELQYIEPQQETQLYDDVCHIIDGARGRIATYVNTEACLTNWYVGKRIKEDVLYNKRAEYGKQVVKNLSVKLTERYGTGWGYEKLKHCVRSAYLFSEGNTEHIEYLMLDEESPIKVAQYYTKLPDKKLLSEKLRKAIAIAREHYNELSKNSEEDDEA